jgi:hypothetical protein
MSTKVTILSTDMHMKLFLASELSKQGYLTEVSLSTLMDVKNHTHKDTHARAPLCVCVCVFIYIYIYIYIYTHTHTHAHTYVHTYIHTHTHMHACTFHVSISWLQLQYKVEQVIKTQIYTIFTVKNCEFFIKYILRVNRKITL